MIYLHDGNFDGFLSCIYEHYYAQKATSIYAEAAYQPVLFDDIKVIPTDQMKAKKVYDSLFEKLTEDIYWDIFYTFLSNDPEKDSYLLRYLIVAFKMGKDIYKLHSNEVTYPVKKISKSVMGERHRFMGLLRFSDVGSCLYAPFEPEHDILMTLSDHFVDRFKNERFIIHDMKRKKAIISNYGKWLITDFELKEAILPSERELLFQGLWKSYFESIAIDTRANKKLQQQFVPLKYRKH
ncbi:MAG: TIGR03915 family putative DNA repair protein, partial [Vallitaleaceae bacterium]|nr:TIGR03915 family putative DNA repair protein [Vallitaleaceae bacterium]